MAADEKSEESFQKIGSALLQSLRPSATSSLICVHAFAQSHKKQIPRCARDDSRALGMTVSGRMTGGQAGGEAAFLGERAAEPDRSRRRRR